MVSPRNAEKARELQQRFGVTIAANQEIAESCDLVIVSLLPPDAPEILKGWIPCRPDRVVGHGRYRPQDDDGSG